MNWKTWKALDAALSDLEERVGLPDFADHADEIGRALRTPPTSVPKSIDARKARLAQAKQDHRREIKSIDKKAADVTACSTPEAQREADEKRIALSDAVRMALIGKDIATADAALNELILDFPLDESISALREDVDRAATSIQNDEDRKIARILRPVGDLTVVASSDGAPRIVVYWTPESSGLAREYRVVRQDLQTLKVSSPFSCEASQFEDTDVVCGVPYKYTVVPCYHGIVVEEAAAETNAAIATVPITSLNIYGEGIKEYAIAHISWMLPAYDETVHLSMILERIHDKERHRVYEAECGTCATSTNKVETHGREFTITTSDEDVVGGETYRYELSLTVSGKVLEPIVREVTIAKLPELPRVTASCYYQEGRHRLHIEWPDGVSEVCLSASGMRPFKYTKDQFSTESVFIPYEDSVRPVEIQAIRRFGQKKIAYGPKEQVRFIDSQRTLFVSVGCAKTGIRAVLSIWQGKEWGIRVSCVDEDGAPVPIPNLEITITNPNEWLNRTFTISAGTIRANEFFKFPSEWGVKRGATIDVSIADGNGYAYIKYLTSQVIS